MKSREIKRMSPILINYLCTVDDGSTNNIFIASGGLDACIQLMASGSDTDGCRIDFNNGTLVIGLNGTINSTQLLNGTGSELNFEADASEDLKHYIIMTVTSVLLGLMILVTVIGNVFVIAAICVDRNLRSVANYLVASLALADLMVACLVMPFGALYQVCCT